MAALAVRGYTLVAEEDCIAVGWSFYTSVYLFVLFGTETRLTVHVDLPPPAQ